MCISKFEVFLKDERRFSLHTVAAYKTDLNQFYDFIKIPLVKKFLCKITNTHVRDWIVFLRQKSISSSSINRKISSLKTFFNFCLREGWVSVSPVLVISHLKKKRKLPIVVTELALNKLFSSNNILFKDNFEGYRDKFIVDLFYQTGIRVSELINIKIIDFNCSSAILKVLGKRNKERQIPLTLNIINTYKKYNLLRSNLGNVEYSDYLFITSRGNRVYAKLIYRIVNHYLSLVSNIQKKSPHVLRHAFATHLLNRGADINAIKDLLGHSSLLATQIYTQVSSDKIKKAYKQFHPRG